MTTWCPHCRKVFAIDPKWWPDGAPKFAVCEPCERDYLAGYGLEPCLKCGNQPGGCADCDGAGVVERSGARRDERGAGK